MVDFAKLNQQRKDRRDAAELILDEIEEELGAQISWWDEKQGREFKAKYLPKILRAMELLR